jgi:hypothetical protein
VSSFPTNFSDTFTELIVTSNVWTIKPIPSQQRLPVGYQVDTNFYL